MAKVVLVSHLEGNKKISIPQRKSEGDIEYLRREFLKHFEKNVKLQITFQHFDRVWEEYVDLEEDAVMHHKDKLKAIVLLKLSDSAPTASTSGSHSLAPIPKTPPIPPFGLVKNVHIFKLKL